MNDYDDNIMYEIDEENQYVSPRKPNPKRTAFIIAVTAVAVLAFFISVAVFGLSASKKTEEYNVAFGYFIESQTFTNLDVGEEKIRYISYSLTSHSEIGGRTLEETAKLGFWVNGKSFPVICHRQGAVWTVCSECTEFN